MHSSHILVQKVNKFATEVTKLDKTARLNISFPVSLKCKKLSFKF